MRHGYIERKDINSAVLAQSEHLGLYNLLKVVKRTAYEYIEGDRVDVENMPDDEKVSAFDRNYGGTLGALAAGVLPSRIKKRREKREQEKEYAQVVVWPHRVQSVWNGVAYRTSLVSVRLPQHFSTSGRGFARNCCTFLDAINTLHHHGFVTLDQNYDNAEIDPLFERNYWFWRYKEKKARVELGNNIASPFILFEPEIEDSVLVRKQFAAIITQTTIGDPIGSCLRAQVGKVCKVTNVNGFYVGWPELSKEMKNLTSRATGVANCETVGSMINWLQGNGYSEREWNLETIFNHLFTDSDDDAHGLGTIVRLYSREISLSN